jgi:hypothetical protein
MCGICEYAEPEIARVLSGYSQILPKVSGVRFHVDHSRYMLEVIFALTDGGCFRVAVPEHRAPSRDLRCVELHLKDVFATQRELRRLEFDAELVERYGADWSVPAARDELQALVADMRAIERQAEAEVHLRRTYDLIRTYDLLRRQIADEYIGASLFAPYIEGPSVIAERNGAEKRAEQLLLDWLSPAQRQQYGEHGSFEVTGQHTRKRYRIRRGVAQNIDELAEDGQPVQTMCFMPKLSYVTTGDVMLAQKIGLEADEDRVLEVANFFPNIYEGGGRRGHVSYGGPVSYQVAPGCDTWFASGGAGGAPGGAGGGPRNWTPEELAAIRPAGPQSGLVVVNEPLSLERETSAHAGDGEFSGVT